MALVVGVLPTVQSPNTHLSFCLLLFIPHSVHSILSLEFLSTFSLFLCCSSSSICPPLTSLSFLFSNSVLSAHPSLLNIQLSIMFPRSRSLVTPSLSPPLPTKPENNISTSQCPSFQTRLRPFFYPFFLHCEAAASHLSP